MYKEDDNVLNELISIGDCANCKICCKFEPDELIDAPTFTKKQMQYIKDNINENLKFTKIDDIYKIQLVKYKSKYKCPLLSEKGCVLPNEYRPFDCESWPFYIMKKSDKFIITKSNDCPIFAKIDNKILTDFIKRKFFIIAEKVVRENPGMITEYNRDLDILYEFSINE